MIKLSYKQYTHFILLQSLTFAIYAVPHVAIIADTDCTTSTIVAFGVSMATVSMAWVRFCEKLSNSFITSYVSQIVMGIYPNDTRSIAHFIPNRHFQP